MKREKRVVLEITLEPPIRYCGLPSCIRWFRGRKGRGKTGRERERPKKTAFEKLLCVGMIG